MKYFLVDAFDRVLGTGHATLDGAKDACEELGESGGEFSVLETDQDLGDNQDASGVSGRRWRYSTISETLVEDK